LHALVSRRRYQREAEVIVALADLPDLRRRITAEPDDIGARLLVGLCLVDVDAQCAAG
jgi:hypothetical protein